MPKSTAFRDANWNFVVKNHDKTGCSSQMQYVSVIASSIHFYLKLGNKVEKQAMMYWFLWGQYWLPTKKRYKWQPPRHPEHEKFSLKRAVDLLESCNEMKWNISGDNPVLNVTHPMATVLSSWDASSLCLALHTDLHNNRAEWAERGCNHSHCSNVRHKQDRCCNLIEMNIYTL